MIFNPRNRILSALEPAAALKARSRLERVSLSRGMVIQDVGGPIEWVWFPDDCLICVASENIEGESVSGGMVGWTGAYGAFEACGSRQSFTRAIVQIPGECWRIRAIHYRELFDESPGLRTAVHKNIEALLVEARQLVACSAIHDVGSRMSRVLLDASRRSHGRSELPLTQDALANMLGVQRTTIAVTASSLQRRGFIQTGRARIKLQDREGLERAACSCYQTITYAEAEIHSTSERVCEA
jgi:CRP-like cAMP-binding protein